MNNSKRILVNTMAQYIRTIINMVLSLYSTRLILLALGVDDYGIYTLLAGFVSMLSFITTALVGTTQRFMSVTQGKNDIDLMKKVFSNCLLLHAFIALSIVIIFEFIGLFLFDGFLNIPIDRVGAGKFIYQCVIFVLLISVIASPFRALLVSHENIVYTSIIDVCDGILKVLAAIFLQYASFDKLELYGLSLVFIQVFNILTFSIYDFIKYKECSMPRITYLNKDFIKSVGGFAGWNVYNTACVVGRNQGVAIIINKFFSTAINSAYGLSFQISGCVGFISQSLKNAIAPQAMKAYGSGDTERMIRLAHIENKLAFTLLASVSIPFIFEMPSLLQLWLKTVPEYSVMFARMVMIATLIDTLTTGYATANLAIGKLKKFSLIVYTFKLITPLVILVCMLFGMPIISVVISYIFMEILSSFSRLYCISRLISLNISKSLFGLFQYTVIPVIISVVTSLWITTSFYGTYRFLFTIPAAFLAYIYISWKTGLSVEEKALVFRIIKR